MPIDLDKKRARQRVWYQKHKQRLREQARKRRLESGDEIRKKDREYRSRNREYLLAYQREYQRNNPDRCREFARRYRERDPEKIREQRRKSYLRRKARKQEYQRQYRKKNRDEILAKRREHYAKNKEYLVAQKAAYREANRDRLREQSRLQKKRSAQNLSLHAKIRSLLSRRIHRAVKAQFSEKAAKTIELIGCSMRELFAHMEKQFKDGMSWENYGRGGWHIDHITPCASFDLTDAEHQRKCFHYTNLQPLWEFENLSKGTRILPPLPVDSGKEDKERG